jgi:predicted nucleic acid-binding protein
MIVVDTSVWSLAFRRRSWPKGEMPWVVQLLKRLTQDKNKLIIPGIVLQELLSGIKEPIQIEKLLNVLGGYPVLLANQKAHIEAANISTTCRRNGIAAATVDCLIAAQCIMNNGTLMTLDEDFKRISSHCALRLYPIPVDNI